MVRVLVVNAGSSTVKLSLIEHGTQTLASCELEAPRAQLDRDQLQGALDRGLRGADAVGHRIVHGGEQFREAVLIDEGVQQELRALVDLAPLHQPKSLAALDAVSALLPGLPAVACFDTAFHADLPLGAQTYALPASWRERWPIRRYGFHGLSHGWVARRAPELLGSDGSGLRIVSCHLGAGASLCAIAGGRSVATTMGFTPLEGLVMATRSGSVDPGLLVWLLEHSAMSARELSDALEHESGLLGLAGTADMRDVLARREAGDREATVALAVYLDRLRGAIGAMATALGGLDALVFTGGVGERSPEIRAAATDGLEFLGIAVSAERNQTADEEADTSLEAAPVRTLVIRAREDLEIARQVNSVVLRAGADASPG
jgi:acetate kinase